MLHAEGPLLTVDLDAREATTEDVDDTLARFIGGRGVNTALAYDRIPFDADPFGPENRVYLSTGPMQASRMSFTGRMAATALSPLTGGLLSSNAGGFLSRNFAGTGNAAVELVGAADELLAVHVRDDGVEFEPVPDLAGAEVPEVTEWAEAEHDLEAEHLACIGPAGENQVRFASVMTSESRAFGRGGIGAVLGAKNVKALTFEGDAAPEIDVDATAMDVHREAATSEHIMKRQGTTSVTDLANEVEAFPTRYFSETSYERAESINGDAVESKKFKKGTCSQCAFACKLPTKDEAAGVETEGPEFETVMSFGGNCDEDDIVEVMRSNEQCDRYGLDTISAGDTVAAYLASEDAFGDTELIHELVDKIAHREGIGDTLAEGVDRVHGELGVDNWTVKGMDFPAHDGRTLNGQGLSFAVANRGADHMYATFYAYEYPLVSKEEAFDPEGLPPEKVERLVEVENTRALEDCGIVCRFSRGMMTPERFEALFEADYDDLLAVGDRVVTLERRFNNERGFSRADDTLPYSLDGFHDALDAYYDQRGWNPDGTVPPDAASGATGEASAD
ncbi:aldehyde ferredoxin oxidoreductase family protein [Halorarum salinum]|uniref:Aldehyde ferredoxin oxidoreductase n=1 Tax=Halorarum salinum TaxID=2743089 RepID=A0A7D5QDY5_9EURY|nr:aldehyde ferredoxin oxidoreductase C-terminal domain-containing protein [Halobaculum salinum]QLG63640.1 aldehyde ferredoxin oxidoreductase [Halobaculum salinum]